jgi:hypothetical protein
MGPQAYYTVSKHTTWRLPAQVWQGMQAPSGLDIPTHTELSSLPPASVLPSGADAIDVTPPLGPVSVRTAVPVATFHKRAVLSRLPLARCFLSDENATDETRPVCPVKV